MAVLLFATVYCKSAGKITQPTANHIYGIIAIVYGCLFVGYLLYGLVNFIIRRPIFGSVVTAIVVLLVGAGSVGGWLAYQQWDYKHLPDTIFLIQESLAEVAAAKEVGDILTAKKSDVPGYFNWENARKVADDMAKQIDDLDRYRLNEYKKVVIAWSERISQAAQDQITWQDVPAGPADFKIKLKKDAASELFARSLAKVDELARFGDYAVERKDKETMRYIAARLLVQRHWLNGLARYEEVGMFAGLTFPSDVYAASQDICTFSKKDSPICAFEMNKQLNEISVKINNLLVAATNYTWGRADAKEKWLEASKQIIDLIEEQGVLSRNTPEEVADIMKKEGILPGGSNELKEESKQPPKLQAFEEACSAKGGTLKETAPNEVGLPALEHGYHCYFQEEQKNCWNFLTYSGSDFAGGEAGCEKHNLLPYAMAKNYAPPQDKSEQTQPEQSSPTSTKASPAAKPTTPKPAEPKPTAPKPQLPDLGQPTGTAAPKIEFVLSQSQFKGNVGEHFQYSFCQPAITRSSDLCTAASTNPRFGLPPYSFSLEPGVGFLPYGLTLNLNGLLEGTPTAEGSRTVGICAKDAGGVSVCRKITISVKAAAKPLTISIDSVKCEFISYTTPWDPNPYWAIYKMTANGSISSANQQVVVIDIGGEETGPPLISCGSWSANVKGNEEVTCAGTGSTSWQYSITINHKGDVPVRYQVSARGEDYSSWKQMSILCSD